jgi:hypothetical protein
VRDNQRIAMVVSRWSEVLGGDVIGPIRVTNLTHHHAASFAALTLTNEAIVPEKQGPPRPSSPV